MQRGRNELAVGPNPFHTLPNRYRGSTSPLLIPCSTTASLTRVTVVLLVAVGNTAALGTEGSSIFFLDVTTLTLLEGQTLSADEVLRR